MSIYEQLDEFEKALQHFRTRVEFVCAREMGGRISPEEAYKLIKDELKELKKFRKKTKKDPEHEFKWLPSSENK